MTWLAERRAADPHFVLKYVLRAVANVFSLISVGTLAAIGSYAPLYGWAFEGVIVFYIPIWVVAIIWNFVWMLIMIGRVRQIVPGLVVAFDLLIWVYYVFPQVWGWFYFVGLIIGDDSYNGEDYYDLSYETYASGIVAAGNTFAFLAMCMHFVLFVIACVDEERRRRSCREQSTAPVPATTAGVQHVVACNSAHCVDCHRPIELRCKQCSSSPPNAAAGPAVGNTVGAQAPVLGPLDLESGRQSQENEKAPSYVTR